MQHFTDIQQAKDTAAFYVDLAKNALKALQTSGIVTDPIGGLTAYNYIGHLLQALTETQAILKNEVGQEIQLPALDIATLLEDHIDKVRKLTPNTPEERVHAHGFLEFSDKILSLAADTLRIAINPDLPNHQIYNALNPAHILALRGAELTDALGAITTLSRYEPPAILAETAYMFSQLWLAVTPKTDGPLQQSAREEAERNIDAINESIQAIQGSIPQLYADNSLLTALLTLTNAIQQDMNDQSIA